jgi:hypothetical protein
MLQDVKIQHYDNKLSDSIKGISVFNNWTTIGFSGRTLPCRLSLLRSCLDLVSWEWLLQLSKCDKINRASKTLLYWCVIYIYIYIYIWGKENHEFTWHFEHGQWSCEEVACWDISGGSITLSWRCASARPLAAVTSSCCAGRFTRSPPPRPPGTLPFCKWHISSCIQILSFEPSEIIPYKTKFFLEPHNFNSRARRRTLVNKL